MRRHTTRARRLRSLALALVGAITLAGCASHPAPAEHSSGTQPGYPVTVTPPGGKPFTMRSRPERIVSLSAADTEILYAVGAGNQVIAVGKQSDYPKKAPHTQINALDPNPEAIAKYQPDLIVASDDTGGLVTSMSKLDIPVLVLPAAKNLDGAYREWSLLGKLTGHPAEAKRVIHNARATIKKIVSSTPRPGGGQHAVSYYHELGPSLYTATSRTFIGSVYSLFGLRNIADPADSASAAGYPQLSAEQVLHADPDLIFLADTECCGQNPRTVAARPGWSALTAVRNGNVVNLDDDIASRWGPRIVQFVRSVSDAVTTLSNHGR